MHNRLTPLLQRSGDLTRAEYRALAFVSDNTWRINKLTVRMLAEETFVSTATIMRLCQKLGFSGFSEFIFHIKLLLNDPALTPLPQMAIQQPTPLAFPQFVANYQRTFDFISAEAVSAFSQLLHQEESFFLYGTGFSHLFAEYLAKKLQILGKTAFASGLGDSRSIFLNNAAKYRVFIAISRSGETEQVLDKARIAHSSGMTVVVFTRASFNSLSRLADIHFQLYDDASNDAVDVGEITSFESNLVMLIDLLLLNATG